MTPRFYKWHFLLVTAMAASVWSEPACAEDSSRGTLMQWSYGTSFEGGPDLSEPLVTDRPDFTEASVTVGRGVAQIESGYTFSYNDDNDEITRSHSFPETLLRVGMFADWFEFRAVWNYAVEDTEIGGIDDDASGAEDMSLGAKIALTPQECILPETAIILQTTVPTGSSDFGADQMLPGFNYLYGWEIVEGWETGGSTGVNATTDGVTDNTYTEFSQSWTVNHGWSDRVGSYAEWFTLVPIGADTNHTQSYFNGGFTVLFGDNVQWDIRAGVGLNDAADDLFAGSGLSVRYW